MVHACARVHARMHPLSGSTASRRQPCTRAFALQTLTDDIGKGLGPPLVSAIIVALGRHRAFNISALFWCVCGILLLLLSRTMGDDEAQVAAAAASTGADWAEQEGGCRAQSEACPGSGDFVRD